MLTAGDSWVLTAPAPARLMVSASPEIETVRKSNGAFEALKKNMRIGRGYNNTNDRIKTRYIAMTRKILLSLS